MLKRWHISTLDHYWLVCKDFAEEGEQMAS